MANKTTKLNLTKPVATDKYDIEVFNENFDKIDNAAAYPIGSVIYNSTGTNPSSYLGYGTWERVRTFYGGELLGYAIAYTTDNGTLQTSGTDYAFSDSSVGPKSYYVQNYLSGVLAGDSGTIKVQTKGIVGMIEAFISISGFGDSGIRGFWWTIANKNALPSGVSIWSSGNRGVLLTGPIDNNYGGNSNTYIYDVTTNSDVSFYVNPIYKPYNGAFTPGSGGVGNQLIVKAYAKGGTNYMWKRVS